MFFLLIVCFRVGAIDCAIVGFIVGCSVGFIVRFF